MRLFLFSVLCLLLLSASGQSTIKGKVISAGTAEELIGATVFIKETSNGTSADLDGNYAIRGVDAGTYTVIAQYISFKADTKKVTVGASEIVTVDFELRDASIEMEVVTIEAKANKASSNYMLSMQKKSANVMDGITAQQIKKSGDSDAAGAVKRVTGVSVEGGKYVYIRGLSDRYAKTTLNGAEIPGLDPNRNTVQLDLYPTSLIDNIVVTKTFSPDLPASYTAGLVNIVTKDFPDELNFYFSSSLGYNTQSTFNSNYLSQEESSTDWLGFDNGKRDVPDVVANNPVLSPCFNCGSDNPRNQLITQQTQAFSKEWQSDREAPSFDHSISTGLGNQKAIGDKLLGFNVGLTYSKKHRYYGDGVNNRYTLTGNIDQATALNPEELLNDQQSTESVLLGGLANVSLKINPNHKVGLSIIRNQSGESTSRYLIGEIPRDEVGRYLQTRNIRYIERSITSNQLKGEHYFPSFKKLKVDWIASYTLSNQTTPDFSIFNSDFTFNSQGQRQNQLSPNLYLEPTRYYRDMEEDNLDLKANFELPLEQDKANPNKIKFGAAYLTKNRDYQEDWYVFNQNGVEYQGDVDSYFADSNMVAGKIVNNFVEFISVTDATDLQNSYTGSQNVFGTYAMVDYKVNALLRLIVGARIETTDIEVESADKTLKKGLLDETDLLPAINGTYSLTEKSNLRFGLSRTLARPTFRELAPYATFDLTTRYVKVGNPELERTLVDNIDLRYEVFPNLGEIFAVSLFYKRFDNPIETVINPFAANTEVTWRNQDFANVYGIELEGRKSMERVTPSLKNFSIGANFTYIYSETQINKSELSQIRAIDPEAKETRQMFGQSPYIVNSYLSYNNDSLGLEANMSFNVTGPKLILVVGGGTPDVYEQPKPSLNFNISKSVTEKWSVKFAANNILNAPTIRSYELDDESYDFQRYTDGVNFSLGLSYKL
ncbi:MAG: TonB-dependent receptor [Vicingaceae bacterium]